MIENCQYLEKKMFSGCKTGYFYILFENCLNVKKIRSKEFFSGSKIRDFHVLFENCQYVEKIKSQKRFYLDLKLKILKYCLKTV